MKEMTPADLEHLIRQTVTYLEFHDDHCARELVAQWQQILARIRSMKKRQ